MSENDTNNNLNEKPLTDGSDWLKPKMPVTKQLAVIGALLIGIFALGGLTFFLQGDNDLEVTDIENNQQETVATSPRSEEGLTFSEVDLVAESALVIDVQSGEVLYQKEPDVSLPLASITKLMTALVAREIVDEDMIIPITASALEQAGDSEFQEGERFSYQNLSDLILLTSSNDGAYALAAAVGEVLDPVSPDAAFVKAMNVRARELGLTNTNFRNPTGLDISADEAGAYGSAEDVAKLMSYIVENHPEILEETTKEESSISSQNGSAHDADNTNRVVGAIATVLGSKTGYTTLAGGNLVVAFDAGLNRPIVAVVLGSSHQGRFSDMLKLVEATRTEVASSN